VNEGAGGRPPGLPDQVAVDKSIDVRFKLDLPPVQDPDYDKEITLRHYMRRTALGVATGSGFRMLNHSQFVCDWANQYGTAHETWIVTGHFLNARNAGVYIGGAAANVATLRGNTNTVIWYALFGSGDPIRVYMGGLNVTREASFEAKSRTKAFTVLGVAGALSLAGGASRAAVGPAGDTPTERTAPVITLGEEEISDVSLATFYVFDNENAGAHRPRLQLAKKHSHGGGRRRAVNRGCGGCAVGNSGGCGGCASGGGPDGL
jgi:hypothetical protein